MSKNILIADSGSTKTDWCAVDKDSILLKSDSIGLNPDFHTDESIDRVIASVQETFKEIGFDRIYFYGSGVSSEARKAPIVKSLEHYFPAVVCEVEHDLLGAARAVHGNNDGLVGILGTGSNCCSYASGSIAQEFRSGGYILSDEGGGVHLGKMILKAFIEEEMDSDLYIAFHEEYGLTVDDILKSIYKEDFPNRFIASFSRFAKKNEEHPQLNDLIKKNFEDFFRNKVARFKGHERLELGIVGSMAIHFQSQLLQVAKSFKVRIGKLTDRPIEELAAYHQLMLEEERS
jgi:N-acetylglucosamine kinase-like BadF-type ATPase